MSFSVRPCDPARPDFAGEVSGIDLTKGVSPETAATIEKAMDHYAVLVFQDQRFDDDTQYAFSQHFGPMENAATDLAMPKERRLSVNINDISNLGADGKVLARDDRRRLASLGNQLWHSDSSFKRISAKASLLAALQVPTEGGETEYTDMRAAYDALSEETRRRIDGLHAFHSAAYSQVMSMGEEGALHPDEARNLPPVRQPLVRVHEPSGRRSLFIGRHAQWIENFDETESRALLDALLEAACQSPRIYRHRWSAGDLVLWDNRCMLHRGRPWDFSQARVMRRTTVADEPPAGDINEWALPD